MNIKILEKVLAELGKEKPDLSYIKGMVETLIALADTQWKNPTIDPSSISPNLKGGDVLKNQIQPVADMGRTPNLAHIKDVVASSVSTQ